MFSTPLVHGDLAPAESVNHSAGTCMRFCQVESGNDAPALRFRERTEILAGIAQKNHPRKPFWITGR